MTRQKMLGSAATLLVVGFVCWVTWGLTPENNKPLYSISKQQQKQLRTQLQDMKSPAVKRPAVKPPVITAPVAKAEPPRQEAAKVEAAIIEESDTMASAVSFPTSFTTITSPSWATPSNMSSDSDSDANSLMTFSGFTSPKFTADTCGFSVPSGATIDGIVVEIRRACSVASSVEDTEVILLGGSGTSSNYAAAGYWTGSGWEVITYGGPTDKWGKTWTDTDINDSAFGVSHECTNSGNPFAAGQIEYIRITVYYTGGGGGGGAPIACTGIAQQARNQRSLSMWDLRQSTASQEIPLGPFVDDTDGKTPETGLTIANTDIKLFKTGATAVVSKNSGGATHDAAGKYYAVLDATDTGTIGPMVVTVQISGALAVSLYCRVLHEDIFDQLYGTSSIGGGPDVSADVAAIKAKTDNLPSDPADASVVAGLIGGIDTKVDTIDTVVDAVKAKTDQLTFTVPNQVDANTLTGGGTGLSSDITAIKAKTDNLPSDPADASVVAGLIGGLDTKLDTIDNFIDTEVAAIKAKTDQLTFTVTNKVDATATPSDAESAVLSSGTATAGGNKTITLQTALGADNMGIGCKIKITSGTGSKQMRRITGYVNSTKVVTVDRAWTTSPDNTSVYAVVYDSDVGATVCRYGAAFTSSAGTTLKISAWLERDGQAVVLASGSCTVTYRENASGSDLFTVTDSAPNAQGIFELSQTSPGFTADRLQVASVEITVGNDTWTTREPVPVFG